MELSSIIFLSLIILLLGFIGFGLLIFKRLYQKHKDLQNFVLDLNNDINDFKRSIDNLTKSNIMVYDDIVFDVVNNCKNIKILIDQYLSKYDEYGNYIYTEEVEEEERKDVIGLIRPGANKGGQ